MSRQSLQPVHRSDRAATLFGIVFSFDFKDYRDNDSDCITGTGVPDISTRIFCSTGFNHCVVAARAMATTFSTDNSPDSFTTVQLASSHKPWLLSSMSFQSSSSSFSSSSSRRHIISLSTRCRFGVEWACLSSSIFFNRPCPRSLVILKSLRSEDDFNI